MLWVNSSFYDQVLWTVTGAAEAGPPVSSIPAEPCSQCRGQSVIASLSNILPLLHSTEKSFLYELPYCHGEKQCCSCSFTFVFLPWWCRGDLTSSYPSVPPHNLVGSCKPLSHFNLEHQGLTCLRTLPEPTSPEPGMLHHRAWEKTGTRTLSSSSRISPRSCDAGIHEPAEILRRSLNPASVPCSSFNLFSQRGIKPFGCYMPLK